MDWADLVATEPRLAAVLTAARDTLTGRIGHLSSEHVYVMSKPLVAWLVGYHCGDRLGVNPQHPPVGSALAALERTARPFPVDEQDPLRQQATYDVACRHVQADLYDLQLAIEAPRRASTVDTSPDAIAERRRAVLDDLRRGCVR